MFRGGDSVEVRFVDLQMCARARPTLDLAVLVATCTTPEFRWGNRDFWTKKYHYNL